MSNGNKEQNEKIRALLLTLIQQDNELRETNKVADKFRFIRDRLNALLVRVDEHLASHQVEAEKKIVRLGEDEILVYVYIYNAQGLTFQTWQKFISSSVFYEYSVNRPIYDNKSSIDTFIRSRSNKHQHGYITVAIKKTDILPTPTNEVFKDALGNDLIKIREGALHFDRLISFTQNGHDYTLDAKGVFQKKIEG